MMMKLTCRALIASMLALSLQTAGAGMIGMRNLPLFDFIAPLGGPVDWNYLGHYIQNWHVGGFCTAEVVKKGDGNRRFFDDDIPVLVTEPHEFVVGHVPIERAHARPFRSWITSWRCCHAARNDETSISSSETREIATSATVRSCRP